MTDVPWLAALPASLGPLDLAAPATVDAHLQRYLDFYTLDLRREFAGLEYAIGKVPSRGRQLVVQVFRPARARGNLLVVHGYLDHVGIYGHAIRYGLQRGLSVVAYDQPGHGLSSGEPVAIDDFADYGVALADVLSACAALPGEWRGLAQSMGGAATLEYLRSRGAAPFRELLLLAPLLRPRGWFGVRAAWWLLHRFRSGVKRGFAVNSHDPQFLAFLEREPLQSRVISVAWVGALRRWLAELPAALPLELPVLLVQGREDATVDWRYNVQRYRQLLPNLRVEYLAQGRHQLVNESADIRYSWQVLADRHFKLEPIAETAQQTVNTPEGGGLSA